MCTITGNNTYYGGGGAGSRMYTTSSLPGGVGGGGASAASAATTSNPGCVIAPGSSGLPNTGGGGGGGGYSTCDTSTKGYGGGSGIVIVRLWYQLEQQSTPVPPYPALPGGMQQSSAGKLATQPPVCMPPGGDRLLYNGTAWVCVCQGSWTGASCTVSPSPPPPSSPSPPPPPPPPFACDAGYFTCGTRCCDRDSDCTCDQVGGGSYIPVGFTG